MSRFLGPIHHWLFNKIVLFEDLEKEIIENVKSELNLDINDIVNESKSEFGDYIPSQPLEDLIDSNNIHGWLQNKINIAESRQAKIITDIINKYGEDAFGVIKSTYKNQGRKSGLDAKEKFDLSTPGEMFKTINNYILDGMPCDNANNVTINEDNLLEWKVTSCLHRKYYDQISGDVNKFYELRKVWIEEFVNNGSDELSYEFSIENNVLIHRIKK